MTTAVDTSVLLDILIDDPSFAGNSERALKEAVLRGRVVVSECVIAEIRPAFQDDSEVGALLTDLGLEFIASSLESALMAGEMYKKYVQNQGASKRVLPDFLIAAHALVHADALLARDRGYYREYFSDLELIDPGAG